MRVELTRKQIDVCSRFGVAPFPVREDLKVGISRNATQGIQPLHGLRLVPEGDTTGWYFWAGEELSSAPDFFVPLHICHLADWRPVVLPYLQLPPGWRILLSPNQEDVWFDPQLKSGDIPE